MNNKTTPTPRSAMPADGDAVDRIFPLEPLVFAKQSGIVAG